MNRYIGLISLFTFALLLTSCSVIEGIFKTGMWTGIIIVVAILALIIWIISRFTRSGRQ